ncbi:low molecular weight protein-tyrosine-phosphatase [Secundilactobacillus oryzae]|uniref:low molecular weight protein-tyrosine-phosphatase n=1 Tax=Secundilactobacillus oryzae TaxID=1202668 RepID=UPI000AEBBD90|nr:low molecular weight protein-tyrosine-phosphatase [Secundilactobacillus oryzae]
MKSVVFVCLGNICRSPMAEAIFNHLVDEAGLSNAITVSSRATSTEEEGNPPHPGAQETMRRHGLDFTGFRSQPISKQDFETADYIITMDQQNVANLKRMAPAGTEQKNPPVSRYRTGSRRSRNSRPWYTHKFEYTYDLLMSALHRG